MKWIQAFSEEPNKVQEQSFRPIAGSECSRVLKKAVFTVFIQLLWTRSLLSRALVLSQTPLRCAYHPQSPQVHFLNHLFSAYFLDCIFKNCSSESSREEHLRELSQQLRFFFTIYTIWLNGQSGFDLQLRSNEKQGRKKKLSVFETLPPFIRCLQLHTMLYNPPLSRPSWDSFSISTQCVIWPPLELCCSPPGLRARYFS